MTTTLTGRDLQIVQLVGRFKQLSSNHIHRSLFELTSRTPCDRALRRLTESHYLSRIERRIVGGCRGGSGQYVYQLGRRGFYLQFTGRYQPARAVNYHSLAIADCYVTLRQLQAADVLSIAGYSTEPDCWATVGGVELRPDMYVDIAKRDGDRLKLFLEIDMGSEAQRQLRGKLEAYWRAYQDADVTAWPVFPRVLWVGVDDERATELSWLIEQGPKDAQGLFAVTTRDKLYSLFL